MVKFIKKNVILLILCFCLSACGKTIDTTSYISAKDVSDSNISANSENSDSKTNVNNDSDNKKNLEKTGKLDLSYATEFSVDYYEDGYCLISVSDGRKYVCVPNKSTDNDLGVKDAIILHYPIQNVYLAASSAMDLFRELDSLDVISACSTKAEDYTISEAVSKINSGEIQYVGKYSAPDYETLINLNCKLAIESTMILHAPKIKEELENMGISVFIDRSSYESEPLGRLEWIKLYGLLTGKEKEACDFFTNEINSFMSVSDNAVDGADTNNTNKKVVFFYITSSGYVNVRKPGDYISKIITMAGGEYALDSIDISEDNALSTINISWEDFYLYAKDADILIYNETVNKGINSIEDLLDENPLFADFKAVKNNNVYCSTDNFYQQTSKICEVIKEMKLIISGNGEGLTFIRHVGE